MLFNFQINITAYEKQTRSKCNSYILMKKLILHIFRNEYDDRQVSLAISTDD